MKKYFLYGHRQVNGYMLLLNKEKRSTEKLLQLGDLKLDKNDFFKYKNNLFIPFGLPQIDLPKKLITYVHQTEEGMYNFHGDFFIADFYLVKERRKGSLGVFVPWYNLKTGKVEKTMDREDLQKNDLENIVKLAGEGIMLPYQRIDDRLFLAKFQ